MHIIPKLTTSLLLISPIWAQLTTRVILNGGPYTDSSGNVWSTDTACTGATPYTTTNNIIGTADPTLFQSGQYGLGPIGCTYTVTANYFYTVTFNLSNTQGELLGQNLFNIYINSAKYSTNFDITAGPGGCTANTPCNQNQAISLAYGPIPVGGAGTVNIVIAQVAGNVILSSLSIIGTNTTIPVTSVALALPSSTFSITGSPITGTGTLTGAFIPQPANKFFAGPVSGANATPTWRSFSLNDLGTQSAATFLAGPCTGSAATPTWRGLCSTDFPTTITIPGSTSGSASISASISGGLLLLNGSGTTVDNSGDLVANSLNGGGGNSGNATCWNGSRLSYCTSVVSSSGTCTCH
jgi:hypothetical protein